MNVFERVVCGVDPSHEGVVAARLAARVADPRGDLALVSVQDPTAGVRDASPLPLPEPFAAASERESQRATALAEPHLRVERQVVQGNAIDALLEEIRRRRATLAVVGTHERPRAIGIVQGSVMTHVLHEAPCSVLVAREPRADPWPRTIVVGVDGSPPSLAAADVARDFARRFGAAIRFVAASGDPHVELERARAAVPELEERDGRAVHELHVLSEYADLVVVGNRGLRGIRALGSVGERVAHEARASVLVVRT